MKSLTQCERVLKALQDAEGEWVSGRYFLHNLYLSQFHARIFELQQKGYKIEASTDTDNYGFKSYRLASEPKQHSLINIPKFFTPSS